MTNELHSEFDLHNWAGNNLMLGGISIDEILDRLYKLGWIQHGTNPEDTESIAKSIKRMQEFYGLVIDGIPGEKTIRALFRQHYGRCSLPDVSYARRSVCKWERQNITLLNRITGLRGVSDDEILNCMQHACDEYNRNCQLNLSLVTDQRLACIVCEGGEGHRDNFDGPMGTLAWAQLPCGPDRVLYQKYDRAEKWHFEMLKNVFLHETGHSLGLEHLPVGNVMQPMAEPGLDRLQPGDLRALHQISPPNRNPPTPDPPEEPDDNNEDADPDDDGNLIGREMRIRILSVED